MPKLWWKYNFLFSSRETGGLIFLIVNEVLIIANYFSGTSDRGIKTWISGIEYTSWACNPGIQGAIGVDVAISGA